MRSEGRIPTEQSVDDAANWPELRVHQVTLAIHTSELMKLGVPHRLFYIVDKRNGQTETSYLNSHVHWERDSIAWCLCGGSCCPRGTSSRQQSGWCHTSLQLQPRSQTRTSRKPPSASWAGPTPGPRRHSWRSQNGFMNFKLTKPVLYCNQLCLCVSPSRLNSTTSLLSYQTSRTTSGLVSSSLHISSLNLSLMLLLSINLY